MPDATELDPLALSFPKLGTFALIDRRDDDGHVGITWRSDDGRLTSGLTTTEHGEQLQAESIRRNRVAHIRLMASFRRMADRFDIEHCVPQAVTSTKAPQPQRRIQPNTCARPRGAGRPRRRSTRSSTRAGPSDDPGEPEPGPRSGQPLFFIVHERHGKVSRALARHLRRIGA